MCAINTPTQVVHSLVVGRFDPEGISRPTLSLVPQDSLQEVWLPLHLFDIGPSAKNGCLVLAKHECVFEHV